MKPSNQLSLCPKRISKAYIAHIECVVQKTLHCIIIYVYIHRKTAISTLLYSVHNGIMATTLGGKNQKIYISRVAVHHHDDRHEMTNENRSI